MLASVLLSSLLFACGTAPRHGGSSEPPGGPPALDEHFEAFVDRVSTQEGGFASNAAQYEGQRVDWVLYSMGYEESGSPLGGGRFRWRERMRLFAGELPPRSDLGDVLDSRWPVIVAVVPGQGEGYEGLSWGDRVRVDGIIRGVGEHDVLFIDNYRITRDSSTGPAVQADPPDEQARCIDRPISEEHAARALARHHRARLDGTPPPDSWPEHIRKVGSSWVVDIDTVNLPGDYPEQIVITVEVGQRVSPR